MCDSYVFLRSLVGSASVLVFMLAFVFFSIVKY